MHDSGWSNQYVYNDSQNFYDFQPNYVKQDYKPSWELAIEKLANTPFSRELEIEKLVNKSKLSWELTIENLIMKWIQKLKTSQWDRQLFC